MQNSSNSRGRIEINEKVLLFDVNEIYTCPRPSCYLCGSQGKYIYQGLKDRIFDVQGEWNLKECENPECKLVWMDPMPLEKDIGKVYHTYYTHYKNRWKRQYRILTIFLIWTMRQISSVLKRITLVRPELKRLNLMYLDKQKPGRLLEIGCGSGQRLAQMRALGWEVEGQEIDPKAAAHASSKGLIVHLGNLQNLSFSDALFDAIIMNHVIEHVHDPVAVLTECYRILKPRGILVVVTPNIESCGHRHFRSFWMGLDPPRHLYLFTRKTLRKIAERAGFSKYEVWTTAAKAQVISAGSLDIKKRGRHGMGVPLKLDIEIMSMFFQLWARAIYIIYPNSGEECVLKAEK